MKYFKDQIIQDIYNNRKGKLKRATNFAEYSYLLYYLRMMDRKQADFFLQPKSIRCSGQLAQNPLLIKNKKMLLHIRIVHINNWLNHTLHPKRVDVYKTH